MTPRKIVDLVVSFSAMSYNNPKDDVLREKVYNYLNLYNLELFRETAFVNHGIHKTILYDNKYIPLKDGGGIRLYEDDGIFGIVSVSDVETRVNLGKLAYPEAMRKYFNGHQFVATNGPVEYAFVGHPEEDKQRGLYNSLYVFPEPHIAKLHITYIVNPVTLSDNSGIEDIPYPVPYHQTLVDGTLWYVFQDDDGFKDTIKAAEAKSREERGKKDLKDFLINTAGHTDVKLQQI